MTAAYYQLPNTAIPRADSYSTAYSYDLNGNLLTLKRNGQIDDPTFMVAIDDLLYTYDNGNKLKAVRDYQVHPAGYNDRHTSANVDDFEYDTFGNMVKNRDKDITDIVYNHLCLPPLPHNCIGWSPKPKDPKRYFIKNEYISNKNIKLLE